MFAFGLISMRATCFVTSRDPAGMGNWHNLMIGVSNITPAGEPKCHGWLRYPERNRDFNAIAAIGSTSAASLRLGYPVQEQPIEFPRAKALPITPFDILLQLQHFQGKLRILIVTASAPCRQ